MIKFFRKIRQNLLSENKFSKYLLYAIGEIILVVIGILIALSINNWQQERQNIKLEQRYLEDLVNYLKQDSVILQEFYSEAKLTAIAKDSIYKVLNDHYYQMDSLPGYFRRQWVGYRTFSPSTSTIEELKSSSHLAVIRNDMVRKQIVNIYYKYDLFLQDEELFLRANRELYSIAKNELRNIDDPTSDEIKLLLQDRRMSNRIRKNFVKGRLQSIAKISHECNSLLLVLRERIARSEN